MAAELRIDYDQFHRRLGLLYKAWRDVTSFVVPYGAALKDDVVYQKSIALHDWLFGYELSDSLMLFTPTTLHVVTSKKKADLLQPLTRKDDSVFVVPLNILVRSKEQDAEHFKTLISAATEAGANVGTLPKETNKGEFIAAWTEALKACPLKQIDVAPCLASVLAVKDVNEIKFVRSAASITTAVLKKHFVSELERIVDEGVKVKHSELADKIDKLLQNPEKISAKLSPDAVEPCYTPIIQSGGKYDLRPTSSSNDDELHFGTIVASMGARYKLYCSNVSRTFFIDPKPEQKANYLILLGAYAEALKALKPGEKIAAAYNAAAGHIEKQKAELLPAFTKNCGFGLGLEFRDGSLLITAKNDKVVQEGMVFNLSVGLQNLELPNQKDEKKKIYSLLVADTVIVGASSAEVITNYPTNYDEVSYSLEDEAADEVKAETKKPKKEAMPIEMSERRLREKEKDRQKESNEQKRKEHQEELARKKREEAEARFKRARESKTGGEVKAPVEDVVAYPSPAAFPSDALPHKIYVDSKHESVLLPVYGVLVPFHISYIKNASKTDEELRINFVAPGAPVIGTKISGMKDNVVYIREMTYKCVDAKNLNNSLRMIKELRKRVTAREAHEKEIKSVVTQEKLIVNKPGVKAPKLTEIFIRPNISGRRTSGTLEAHKNGLRFSSSKGSQIDILYKNVKHAFLQPAEHEMLVLIHFHLHDGIMVGKKKTSDVQFYTEVMELSHALDGGGKRSMYDADEIEDEQRERELRARMNDEFQKFVRKVEEASTGELEFDIPYRDLGFHGVPHRSSVFMQPTVNCLVHLTEPPFTVVTLNEVEVASLERVQFSLKNFDLVFIFKNFSFTHINTIPMDSLETIKEWLDSCNIKYYESPQNLNWGRITTHIKENPEEFYKDGGFEFLSSDNEDGEDDESEESDASFQDEAKSDAGSGGSDSEEDEEYEEEASDEDSPDEEEESDEDAPSWDELERDAAKADKERGTIDEDAPKTKRRGEYSDDEADRERAKKAAKPKASATPAAASKPKTGAAPSKK